MLPAGSADADANSDAATAAARCLYPNCTHVRVCVHRREVDYETRAMRILLNIRSIYLRRLARLTNDALLQSDVKSWPWSLFIESIGKGMLRNVCLNSDFITRARSLSSM